MLQQEQDYNEEQENAAELAEMMREVERNVEEAAAAEVVASASAKVPWPSCSPSCLLPHLQSACMLSVICGVCHTRDARTRGTGMPMPSAQCTRLFHS